MNKKIIINGVDVTKCLAYHPEFGSDYNCLATCSNCSSRCEASPYCYYKQLQRKSQELEIICKEFDIEYARDEETEDIIGRCNKLLAKEQECEELKKELELYKTWYRVKHDDWCDVFFKRIKSNKKYQIALSKIAKIVNNISNYMNTGCNMDKCEECNHTKPYCTNQCVCYLIQQGKSIVDIIKEVDKCS